jgi:hypothetical protein
MIVDRNYIFTLYQMGAGAIYRYFKQIEKRIDDAESRATPTTQACHLRSIRLGRNRSALVLSERSLS